MKSKEDRKFRAKVRRADNRNEVLCMMRDLRFMLRMKRHYDEETGAGFPIRLQNNRCLSILAHYADEVAIMGAAAHRELERRFANTRKQRGQIEARLKYMHTPEAQHRHLQRRMKGATIPL